LRLTFFISVLLLFVVFITSCEDDPTSVGSNLLPGDDLIDFIELDSYNENLTQVSTYFQHDFTLGQSNRLLLGEAEGLKANTLMRFFIPITNALGEKIDSNKVTILSAKVFMYPDYTIGNENGQFGFDVYKVNSTWTVDSFTVADLNSLDYDAQNEADSLSISDSLITFNVNPNLVYDWIIAELDSNITNPNGFLFKPYDNCERIFGFPAYSISATGQTYMDIAYEVQDEYVDTLTATINSDVHIVEGSLKETSEDVIVLQAGIGVRGLLKFDLSSIPVNSIINDATLEIKYDSTASVIGTADPKSIRVFLMSNYDEKTSLDSLGYFVLSREGDVFSGKISRFVQRWVYDPNNNGTPNEGLLLLIGDEEDSVNKYILYGSQAQDAALRPRLKVIYSRKL
jgi:hypothetical protein